MKKLSLLLLAASIQGSAFAMRTPPKMGIPVSYNRVSRELAALDELIVQLRNLAIKHSRPAGLVGIPTDAGQRISELINATVLLAQQIKTTVSNAQNNLKVLSGSKELQGLVNSLAEFTSQHDGIFKINLEGIPQQATNLYDRVVTQLNAVITAITNAPV